MPDVWEDFSIRLLPVDLSTWMPICWLPVPTMDLDCRRCPLFGLKVDTIKQQMGTSLEEVVASIQQGHMAELQRLQARVEVPKFIFRHDQVKDWPEDLLESMVEDVAEGLKKELKRYLKEYLTHPNAKYGFTEVPNE